MLLYYFFRKYSAILSDQACDILVRQLLLMMLIETAIPTLQLGHPYAILSLFFELDP